MIRPSGPLRATAVALAAAALAFGAARSTASVQLAAPHEAAGLPESSDVLVEDATLACPGQQRVGGESLRDVAGALTVASGAAPLAALPTSLSSVPTASGTVTVSSGGTDRPLVGGVARDEVRTAPVAATSAEPVLVSGAGGLAPGLVGTQTWRHRGDDDRALVVTPCQVPSSDVWLVGGGDGPSRTERVIVTNPGANAVAVDLELYGAEGPVAADQARGLSVPPRGRIVLSLDALAPGEVSPAVHVIATGGVVSAVLDDAWIDGATGRGADDATRSASPATDLIVPGVDVAGVTRLRIVNPGEAEALVQVRVLTATGPSQPAELRAVRVPAESTTDVALTLPRGGAGLRLVSDQPVTAGAYVERRAATGADRMGDFGWAPATSAVRSTAGLLLPGLSGAGATTSLLLSAGVASRVTVTLGTGASATSRVVPVAADSTVTVPVGSATSLWIRVDSGEVHAAATVAGVDGGAPFFSVAAITGSPVSALAIPVRQVRR